VRTLGAFVADAYQSPSSWRDVRGDGVPRGPRRSRPAVTPQATALAAAHDRAKAAAGTIQAFYVANALFHERIYTASHNGYLASEYPPA
jgi:hypothetical protein